MKKIKMLKDEIVNTPKGPIRFFAGEELQLTESICDSLVGRGYAEFITPEEKEEEVQPASAKPKSKPRKRSAKPKVVVSDEEPKEE